MGVVRSGKGDKGYTDLFFRHRISKDSPDIRAIGNLDELNCYLGLIRSKIRTRKDKAIVEKIQRAVLIITSEIAVGAEKKEELGLLLKKDDAVWIKSVLYELETKVPLERCFYLPGSGELSAYIDVARSVARRAERSVVGLFRKEKVKDEYVISYLNCISDVLFIMARKHSTSPGKKRASGKVTKTKKTGRKK